MCIYAPPVSTDPLAFRSFGIPPANKPPICGAVAITEPVDGASAVLALLLLILFATAAPGIGGGADIVGSLANPAGEEEEAGPGPGEEEEEALTKGALRSLVTALRSFIPPEAISLSKAP